jgi:TnpA family transposase
MGFVIPGTLKELTYILEGLLEQQTSLSFAMANEEKSRNTIAKGQEDQLSALGLVTNAVVLWNTMYFQKTLEKLKQDGFIISDEDVSRLSPLHYKHI